MTLPVSVLCCGTGRGEAHCNCTVGSRGGRDRVSRVGEALQVREEGTNPHYTLYYHEQKTIPLCYFSQSKVSNAVQVFIVVLLQVQGMGALVCRRWMNSGVKMCLTSTCATWRKPRSKGATHCARLLCHFIHIDH